jgi:hypothetical protein
MNEPFSASDNLRALVGRKLAEGNLPRGALGAVSQTNGSSEVCDACAEHLSPSDVLYRVYGAGYRRFHFHRACFSIWRVECTQTLASPSKRTDWNLSAP